MNKPQMKREIAVATEDAHITFHATPDMAETVRRAGLGYVSLKSPGLDSYALFVDPRFDYAEVVAWIESLGSRT